MAEPSNDKSVNVVVSVDTSFLAIAIFLSALVMNPGGCSAEDACGRWADRASSVPDRIDRIDQCEAEKLERKIEKLKHRSAWPSCEAVEEAAEENPPATPEATGSVP